MCYEVKCEHGSNCDKFTGECVKEDLCKSVKCDDYYKCDPDSGKCGKFIDE